MKLAESLQLKTRSGLTVGLNQSHIIYDKQSALLETWAEKKQSHSLNTTIHTSASLTYLWPNSTGTSLRKN